MSDEFLKWFNRTYDVEQFESFGAMKSYRVSIYPAWEGAIQLVTAKMTRLVTEVNL